jgi:hypothetical protein
MTFSTIFFFYFSIHLFRIILINWKVMNLRFLFTYFFFASLFFNFYLII